MARKKNASGADIDWYLISIDTLKKIGAIALLIALGVGGWYYSTQKSADPRHRAEVAIADAADSLNRLASSPELKTFRADFDRAQKKLDESRQIFGRRDYPLALSTAVEAETIAQAALSRQPGERDADAQFLTLEGTVSFQRAGGDWKPAEARTPLYNGDWVKTGSNSTAELMFSNGSLYTIGENALLEIYSLVNPATSKKQNTVNMQIGSIEVATDDEISTVKTPGTQVVVESKSTAQVGVDQQKGSTEVLNLRGSTRVAPAAGGPAVQLATGEKISASNTGAISPVRKVQLPPALLGPADNQVFQAQRDLELELRWAPQAARSYRLQVSRSRLFSAIEIDSRRPKNTARVRITDDGSFYWRVAAVDATGETGPFSTFRRFRVAGVGAPAGRTLQGDKTPPALRVKRPFNIGGQFYMIEGTVEPGATVFVNDEEIDVDTSGQFKKFIGFDKVGWNAAVITAVDPAGNKTVRRENVYVEE